LETVRTGESSAGQSIAGMSWAQGFATAREKELAGAAFSHWRQRADARKHDVNTMNALLPSMGRPVQTVDEFFDHFASGRVVVQVRADPDNYRVGHSSFYCRNKMYEMKRSDDKYVTTRYKAKFATYQYSGLGKRPDQRSYIAIGYIPEEDREVLPQIGWVASHDKAIRFRSSLAARLRVMSMSSCGPDR
jgi:hypothetical protein